MAMKGFTRKFKPLEILSEEQIEAIHKGTLEVLWETGVTFHSEKALKLFEKNDCKVDYGNKRVKFPGSIVEEILRRCPSSFRLKARNSKNDIILGGNTVYFEHAPGMNTVDLDTWEPRPPTRKEFYNYAKILDALPNLHSLTVYPWFGFADVPAVMRVPEDIAARLRSSDKVVWQVNAAEADIWNIKLAEAFNIDIVGVLCASPPLTYYEDQIESAFRMTEAGFPFGVVSGCVHGGTGPSTIAGSLLTDSAELIAGIVLLQLLRPGTRVIAVDQTNPQNMRSGSPYFDNIGSALHAVAGTQLWRKYEIPHIYSSAGYTNSKVPDIQNGYERATHVWLGALAGDNIIPLHGGIYGEVTAHPVIAIIDDDLAGMVGRFLEGIEVNDETLAIDLINEVGPIPGFYLGKEHTRKWWKKEQYTQKIADVLTYPEWIKMGKKSCLDYAKERMEEILATHKPTPLTPDQEKIVEDVLKEAREYYRKNGKISEKEWSIYMKTLESPEYPYG